MRFCILFACLRALKLCYVIAAFQMMPGNKIAFNFFVFCTFLHLFPPFQCDSILFSGHSIVSLIQMRTLLHFRMPATIAQ